MQALWHTIFYQPVYNIVIFLMNNVTFGDLGFAVILVTIIIKFILYPLTKKSIKSQILMKRMEPEIKLIKKNYPNKEEQAKKTFELYKKYGTNPFSGCLVVLIQLPVIFALYFVILKGLSLDGVVYSFISKPTFVHTNFLGFIEMGSKSVILALLAGATQFIQGYLASPIKAKKKDVEITTDTPNESKSFQDEMANSMQMNVKYILPIFITMIAWQISAAVALYFVTSNIFTIVQEWYIRKTLENK